jgi:hypothetical protein
MHTPALNARMFKQTIGFETSFFNNANVMIDRHPLFAGYLLSYMSIISGDVVDSPFSSADQYDQQFRLRIAYN